MKNGPYEMVVAPSDYPGKRYRGRYVYEHHLVWWQHTRQVVPEGFVIHHKDENKRNNEFSNFELKTAGDHSGEHSRERRQESVIVKCGWCGETFEVLGRDYPSRMTQSKSGELYCSTSHQVKAQWKQRR